ncbi:hypothetical protein N7495_006339 [Penicillium taxi]|uniref:uncharacterized protein n=1 Tax=Penicillium taxi TaxID=168475 RepID=UPI002545731E|nr:uncharacterized protein N7495_006339 [Penicillium taxi]KAJ5894648.1 hypothetical protein N7495_006339 [Penicillium taxi]
MPARYGRWAPSFAVTLFILFILHLNSNFGVSNTTIVVETVTVQHPLNTSDNQYKLQSPTPSQSHGQSLNYGQRQGQSQVESQIQSQPHETQVEAAVKAAATPRPCLPLPGMEDILVVLKTGITESQQKVPVHVRTTLRCVPHKLIVSDFEEDIDGIRTHDVFRNTSSSLLEMPDFALYNRARAGGRAGLTQQDLNKVPNGPFGMVDSPGWKLDKWKFLPMIHEARRFRPQAKWYVFYEADTYPIWTNLLGWLAHFDPDQKLYLGNQMMIGDDLFAHGGSGIVISHAALHAVADWHMRNEEHWNGVTQDHWAGDCLLGMALSKTGIGLTWSAPHTNERSVWEQDTLGETYGKNHWCVPPWTFHHMTPADVEFMWEFEQNWFYTGNHTLLLHRDIFYDLIEPSITDRSANWDNLAGEEVPNSGESSTKYECAEQCARTPECMQYKIDAHSKCLLSPKALRGNYAAGVDSGSMMWRVEARIAERGECLEPLWLT